MSERSFMQGFCYFPADYQKIVMPYGSAADIEFFLRRSSGFEIVEGYIPEEAFELLTDSIQESAIDKSYAEVLYAGCSLQLKKVDGVVSRQIEDSKAAELFAINDNVKSWKVKLVMTNAHAVINAELSEYGLRLSGNLHTSSQEIPPEKFETDDGDIWIDYSTGMSIQLLPKEDSCECSNEIHPDSIVDIFKRSMLKFFPGIIV